MLTTMFLWRHSHARLLVGGPANLLPDRSFLVAALAVRAANVTSVWLPRIGKISWRVLTRSAHAPLRDHWDREPGVRHLAEDRIQNLWPLQGLEGLGCAAV